MEQAKPEKFSAEDVYQATLKDKTIKTQAIEIERFYFKKVKQLLFKCAKPSRGTWAKVNTASNKKIFIADQIYGGMRSFGRLSNTQTPKRADELNRGPFEISCEDLNLLIQWLWDPKTDLALTEKQIGIFRDFGNKLMMFKQKYGPIVLKITQEREKAQNSKH